jgi:hypothetical protein
MSKILKCKFEEWEGMQVVEMPLDALFVTVQVALPVIDYAGVMNDIKKNGMKMPIQVVHCTAQELRVQKQHYKNQMLDIPKDYHDSDIMYAVWGGSNRVDIARKLEYNIVDCVIYPMDLENKFKVARDAQSIQRKGFEHLYRVGKNARRN